MGQYAGQNEQYCGQNQRRRGSTHQTNGPVSNQFASASFGHSTGYRHHTSEQENGYPVDGSICLFFSQAAGQYANQCADDSSHFQSDQLSARSHYQNNDYQNSTGNHHFGSAGFASFNFLLDFLVSIQFCFRKQIFTNKHHVNHAADGDRNTDQSPFEEAEQVGQTSCLHSALCNDVRRSTNQSDDTTPTASECQRHQLTGSGDFSGCANAQSYRQQASCSTSVGQECGQNSTYGHQTEHQAVLASTNQANYFVTNSLSKAGVEHGSANYEHTCEKYYSGVRKTAEYLFNRDEAQKAAGDSATHSSDCEGNDFGNEE